jgi:hypothetical protein
VTSDVSHRFRIVLKIRAPLKTSGGVASPSLPRDESVSVSKSRLSAKPVGDAVFAVAAIPDESVSISKNPGSLQKPVGDAVFAVAAIPDESASFS